MLIFLGSGKILPAKGSVSSSKLPFGLESIGSIQHHGGTKNKIVVDLSSVPLEMDQRGDCAEKLAPDRINDRETTKEEEPAGLYRRSSIRGVRLATTSSFAAASRPSMASPTVLLPR
jgi:hypothetical protein